MVQCSDLIECENINVKLGKKNTIEIYAFCKFNYYYK